MHDWDAEIEVSEELVHDLISAQFAALRDCATRFIAAGWDTSVWLVDERFAFRFPRREAVVPNLHRQVAVLPSLAQYLPLPIPEPLFVGTPSDRYPWPFFGAHYLRGREVQDAGVDPENRSLLARGLALFLATLHSPSLAPAVASELELDPQRRGDMRDRVPRTRVVLDKARALDLWRPSNHVDRLLAEAEDLPAAVGRVVLHGDLHFRQLLVSGDGRPSGVIDWVDVCLGAPAIDLSAGWSMFPANIREEFFRAYGPIDEQEMLRARVVAIFLCAVLAVYGSHEQLPGVTREALAGLARATSEE